MIKKEYVQDILLNKMFSEMKPVPILGAKAISKLHGTDTLALEVFYKPISLNSKDVTKKRRNKK